MAIRNPVVLLWLLPLLAACSRSNTDAFFDGLIEVMLLAALASLVAACFGAVLLALQLAVVVLNVVRPSKASMVTGYVLAGLHAFAFVGSVLSWSLPAPVSEPDSANALVVISTSPAPNFILSLVMSAVFVGLLGGSAWYAQTKLAPPPAGTDA